MRKAAKTLELGTLLERRPRQLSGGQRQRVAMGRAIVREPAVFLFDEPLSNLDAKLRVQMRLEIKRLQRELAVTSIYVTHDQVEAMTMADRLIVMNAGVADQIGTPMDVYDRPASVFVAGFIGSPAMNFLAAKVGRTAGRSISRAPARSRCSLPLARADLGARPARRWRSACGPSTCCRRATGRSSSTIELAEPLGADTLLHGRFGDARELVTVRQGGHVTAPSPARSAASRSAPAQPAPVQFADRPAHRLTTPDRRGAPLRGANLLVFATGSTRLEDTRPQP